MKKRGAKIIDRDIRFPTIEHVAGIKMVSGCGVLKSNKARELINFSDT